MPAACPWGCLASGSTGPSCPPTLSLTLWRCSGKRGGFGVLRNLGIGRAWNELASTWSQANQQYQRHQQHKPGTVTQWCQPSSRRGRHSLVSAHRIDTSFCPPLSIVCHASAISRARQSSPAPCSGSLTAATMSAQHCCKPHLGPSRNRVQECSWARNPRLSSRCALAS